ncbi:NACHT domain-containing protein [Psychromonas sp. KJ10-2]|uniref:NACHT domain-containing protein n=1 Tax=Psychromonas sp. KJ10-2 TaxID=3391822 RepID=UPI0039B54745
MLETITLDSAVKLSTPLAKKLFNAKLKPIITDKISEYFKSKADNKTFEKESVKYIARVSGLCSTMNTIAFPNTPKKLEDLYIPLKIIGENDNEIVINNQADIFKSNNKVLVNDTAGMGKSTLSKRVFLNIIEKEEYIPVFIELRQLARKPLARQITSKFGVDTKNPINFLKELPLVYLFDGLDEVDVENKDYIIKEIRKFIDDLVEPKILITSRLESYLSEFYDFTRFTINPLKVKEAFSLISKYDPKGDVSKKLISGINRSRDRGLKDFLSTPLYVSLLFCAYRHKTVIPQKKHLFILKYTKHFLNRMI